MQIYFFYSIICILSGYLAYKKPYLGVVIICLLSSMGPLIKLFLGIDNMDVVYAIYTLTYGTIVLIKHFSINPIVYLYFNIVFVVCLLQYWFIDLSIFQMGAALLKYVAFPFIAYFSAKSIVKNNINISYILTIYIIPNLLIMFFRVFVDYSFLGIIYDVEYGSPRYRPSSFNSAIIFSIELAIYLCLLSITSQKTRYFIIATSLAAVPLLLMHSRSSYIILIMFFVFYIIIKKKYTHLLTCFGVGSLCLVIYVYLQNKSQFLFNVFNDLGFDNRFGSISDSMNMISNQGILVTLFGRGIGAATPAIASRGLDFIYVENTFISMTIESGIIFLLIFLIFNTYVFMKSNTTVETRLFSVILIAVLITNLFAANLLSNTIILIYLLIIFYITERLKLFVNSRHDRAMVFTVMESVQSASGTIVLKREVHLPSTPHARHGHTEG